MARAIQAERRRYWRDWVLGIASLATGAAAMALSHARRPTETDWPALALWIVSLGAALAVVAPRQSRDGDRRLARSDLAAALGVAVLAGALLLPFLSGYPLEMAGDPPRDGGLFTQAIATGQSREIFGYGANYGFGKVVSLTGVPFYLVFGPSPLTFKALAAAIGIATSVLLFLMARRHLPLATSVAAALFLLALPVFDYYARSEPVVIYSSLWMIAVLAAVLRVLQHGAEPRSLALVGMVAGLTANFHGGVKGAGFAAMILCGGISIWRAIRHRQTALRVVVGAGAAVLAFAVGFGPLAVHTELAGLVSKGRITGAGGSFDPQALFAAYQRSLRVFFDQPTRSWFPVHQPLIPSPVLSSLFALGAILGFTVAPLELHLAAVFFLVVLPFTNSAVTDLVNADHRLTALLPLVALVTALGVAVVWRAAGRVRHPVARRALRVALILLVTDAAVGQVYRFFALEQGRLREEVAPHLMYFALEDLEQAPALRDSPDLCVSGDASLRAQMELEHYRLGWSYYLPDRTVRLAELAGAAPNELFLSATCPANHSDVEWSLRVHCDPRQRFVCPGEETGVREVRILLDDRPAASGAMEEVPGSVVLHRPPPPPPLSPSRLLPDTTNAKPGRIPVGELTLVDLAARLRAGQVKIEVNDAGFTDRIGDALDGEPRTMAHTAGVNPLIVDVELSSPIRLRAVRLLLAGSLNDWVLEASPGSRRYLLKSVAEGEWSQIDLPRPEETRAVRIEVLRLVRNDDVHVSEIELYTEP